jgi:citrate lyase subunit beta / citryl-CoA lyase
MHRYRSLLFAPGNQERMIEKTTSLPADAVVLDLEDAVPRPDLDAARETIRAAVKNLRWPNSDVFVRVNAGEEGLRDLEALGDIVVGVLIPKVESPEDIGRVRAWLGASTVHGHADVPLIATIETALGALRALSTFESFGPITGLIYGSQDFAASVGSRELAASDRISLGRLAAPTIAAALHAQAIDSASMSLRDETIVAAEVQTARALGFTGKVCIHPAQLGVVNAGFGSHAHDMEWAKRVVSEYDRALAEGRGAIQIDGELIDQAHYVLAQRLLAVQSGKRSA